MKFANTQTAKKLLPLLAIFFFGATAIAVAQTQSPPLGNTNPPINDGATAQVKTGGLSVGSLIVGGGSVLSGDITFGRGSLINSATEPSLNLRANRYNYLRLSAIENTSNTEYPILQGAGNNLSLFTSNINRLEIDSAGNVGIGDPTPDAKLDVSGQITGGFGAVSTSGGSLDWNNVLNARSGSGFTLLLGSHTNGPGSGNYFHPFSFEYSTKDGSGNLAQFAIPYHSGGQDDGIFFRTRYGGTWEPWSKVLSEDRSGNVAIGSLAPSAGLQLDVAGNIGAAQYCDQNGLNCVSAGGSGGGGLGGKWNDGATTGEIYYNAGNVGVGIADPNYPLHIAGTTYGSGLGRFDGGVQVDGLTAVADGNVLHEARSGTGTYYGYFQARDNTGARGFYLGFGDGAGRVDLNLDAADTLYVAGGGIGIGDPTLDGGLELDVAGDIGADSYCDGDGTNCVTSTSLGGKWLDGNDPDEIYYSAANVGIGTANPQEQLSVSGDGTWQLDITTVDGIARGAAAADDGLLSVDGHLIFQIDDNNNQSAEFEFYDGAENLVASIDESGIGDFSGGIQVDSYEAIYDNNTVHESRWTSTSNYGYFQGRNSSGDRGFYLGYGNGGTRVDLFLDNAEDLYISGGNVGIGVTDATEALHVAGNLRLNGSGNSIYWDWSGRGITQVDEGGGSRRLYVTNSGINSDGSNPIGGVAFAQNTSLTPLMLLSQGQVVLNDSTPDAGLLLDVEGQVGATGYCDEDGANCSTAVDIATVVSSGGGLWTEGATVGEIYYNGGNVGIGTTDPSATFDVVGGDALVNGVTVGMGAGAVNSNTSVGSLALASNATGQYNTAIGREALENSDSNNNTAVGRRALHDLTTGYQNTAVGREALSDVTTTHQNTAIGFYAMLYGTGTYNTALGANAFRGQSGLSTGSYNVALGGGALYSNTTGSHNMAMGYTALYANTTGAGNLAAGYQALRYNTTADYNTAWGYQALRGNTTGSGNSATGFASLYTNTTGNYNVGYGMYSLRFNTTGSGNVATGYQSLYDNTTGGYNTALGYAALANNTTANYNVGVGYNALVLNTSGDYSNAVGVNALYSNTTGYRNNALGFEALRQTTTGYYNDAVGFYALRGNTDGVHNVGVGTQTQYNNTTGDYNTTLGGFSIYDSTTGSNNTVIGYNTGRGITTGSANTIIGANVTGLSSSLSNNIIIADGSGNRRINVDASGNVGINTDSPVATNESGSASTGFHVDFGGTGTGDVEAARFEAGSDSDNTAAVVRINHSNDRGLYLKGGRAVSDSSFGQIGVIQTDGSLSAASITLDDAGDVAIGSDTDPASQFTVTETGSDVANFNLLSASGDTILTLESSDGVIAAGSYFWRALDASTVLGYLRGDGQMGAVQYCDQNGANCSTPADIANAISGSGADNLGDHTATTNLNMNGYYINVPAPVTTGGWARGMFLRDSSNTTEYGSIGALGSGTSLTRLYLAAGTNAYSSGLGLYVVPAGNVGVGTVSPNTNANAAMTVDGWISRTAHNNGALMGSYNNVGANTAQSNPIYAIGSSYLPNATTLGNFYGIGYTNGNSASFTSTNFSGSGWGAYYAADGDARVFIDASNGRVMQTGTPTLDNHLTTKAYVDGAISGAGGDDLGNHTATTNLNLNAANREIQWTGNQNLSADGSSQFIFRSNNSTVSRLTLRNSSNSTYGSVYADSGLNIGLLDSDGNWAIKADRDTDTRFYINNTERARVGTTQFVTDRFGIAGTYNSAQTQGIWSIGDAYDMDSTTTFGNQYGLAYSYNTVGGGISGWQHQIHFVNNGTRNATISLSNGGLATSQVCDQSGANCSTPAAIATAVAGGGGGDDLGNHTATQNLDMASNPIGGIDQLNIATGNGRGIQFWTSAQYAIAMGNASEYQYGPVTDYSIKMHMSNTTSRGWTFGVDGQTPTIGFNTQGNAQFAGTVTAASFVYSSDENLKENILPIGNARDLLNLGVYSFDWKEGTDGSRFGPKSDVGLIAQEVEEYFPELVETGVDGYKRVDYAQLVAPLLELTKEQQAQIDDLEDRLQALEERL